MLVADATIVVGLLLFRKCTSPRRPAVDSKPTGDPGPQVEDRIPRLVVYFPGAAASAVVIVVVTLLVVE